MSGPKCVEIREDARAILRKQCRKQCASLQSEYSRLEAQLADQLSRMAEVGLPGEAATPSSSELDAQIQESLAKDLNHEAVAFAQKRVDAIKASLKIYEAMLKKHILSLEQRFSALRQGCALLEHKRDSFAAYAIEGLPDTLPATKKNNIEKLRVQVLQSIVVPKAIEAGLNRATIGLLEKAEAILSQSMAAADDGKIAIENAINAIHADTLDRQLAKDSGAPMTYADYQKKALLGKKAVRTDNGLEIKLAKLLEQVTAFLDSEHLAQFMGKASQIRGENDPQRKQMLYDSLELHCAKQLDFQKQLTQLHQEIDALIDSVAHLKGQAIDELVARLGAMRKSRKISAIEPLKTQIAQIASAEEKRLEREHKRRAIVESLSKLGYQTVEGMQTAFIKNGRLVVQQQHEEEYAVEVILNEDSTKLQSRVIRYAASADSSRQQKLRDHEQEVSWCAGHSAFLEEMAKRGWPSEYLSRSDAGKYPVKVVIDENPTMSQRRRSAPKKARMMQPG